MSADASEVCVLVVDDEAGIRDSLVELVEMTGCVAASAADGAEALVWLETHRPCLIFLDLLMPNVSGTQMLAEMKKRPELAALPVVISTSAPHLAPAGVPVLPKPIHIEAAFEWIHRVCRCRDVTPT